MRNVNEIEYSTRETYQGEIRDGKKHGTGIFEANNGDIYLGEWESDFYSGEGILIKKNGERYEGQMKKGVRHGDGIYYYIDGRVFKGTWADDEINGYGAE
jgi:hypothetical protein